jgi:hypothetical protein
MKKHQIRQHQLLDGTEEKSTRTYNYHFNKLKKYTKENTCGIQAQVRDIMMDTLDALV